MRLRIVSLVFGLLVTASVANATDSWVRSPSWSSGSGGDSSAPRTRSSFASRELQNAVSPFSPGSNNLALDVGQVFLMGNLSSSYSDNIGGQLHYTYGVSDLFGFDSSLGYSEHSDGKFSMTTLLTGLRTNLSWYDKVIPYGVFGLGFYRPSFEVSQGINQVPSSVSPVLFGVHLGAGVDLEVTKQLFFGAALTFHDIFGSARMTQNGLLDVGGTYTSFFVHAGVTF